jgi:hypothetical protein
MQAQKLAQPPAKLAQTKMSGVERMKPSSQKSWMGASNLFAVCGNEFAGMRPGVWISFRAGRGL